MKNYTARITRMTIVPEGEPIFSENATHISIEDEAGGEYVAIQQYQDYREPMDQRIAINPEEWFEIRNAINETVEDIVCREKKSEGEGMIDQLRENQKYYEACLATAALIKRAQLEPEDPDCLSFWDAAEMIKDVMDDVLKEE